MSSELIVKNIVASLGTDFPKKSQSLVKHFIKAMWFVKVSLVQSNPTQNSDIYWNEIHGQIVKGTTWATLYFFYYTFSVCLFAFLNSRFTSFVPYGAWYIHSICGRIALSFATASQYLSKEYSSTIPHTLSLPLWNLQSLHVQGAYKYAELVSGRANLSAKAKTN